jgi:type IV pilus assembly protein PilB
LPHNEDFNGETQEGFGFFQLTMKGGERWSTARAQTHQFFEGPGCIDCGGTGFKGRTAICELLDLSDRIREMILDRRPASEIKKAAHEEGMRFLRESAVEKVLHGLTTLREINKVTFVE